MYLIKIINQLRGDFSQTDYFKRDSREGFIYISGTSFWTHVKESSSQKCLGGSDSCFLPDGPCSLIASVRPNCAYEPETGSSHLHAPPPPAPSPIPHICHGLYLSGELLISWARSSDSLNVLCKYSPVSCLMCLINVAADPPGHLWYFVSQNDEDFLIHPDSPSPQFDSLSILQDDGGG